MTRNLEDLNYITTQNSSPFTPHLWNRTITNAVGEHASDKARMHVPEWQASWCDYFVVYPSGSGIVQESSFVGVSSLKLCLH